ncbi:MAG: arylsulfatase A-like enzyme [Planctomycetota bacterium]|jgi:arylsulfatase A-like enzyme
MKHKLHWIPVLLFLVGCNDTGEQSGDVANQQTLDSPPNIVLVLADDLGIGDPRCYNPASGIATPAMDRLAREGMRLTDMHTPSAVCTPTRYGLLTGRYAWRSSLKSGVLWGNSPALIEPERQTVASLLRDAGYETACIGKWHLGFGDQDPVDYDARLDPGPLDLGFDRFFGIPASLDIPPYLFIEGDRSVQPLTTNIEGSSMARSGGGGFWREGEIAEGFRHEEVLDRILSESQIFLGEQAAMEDPTPFFLYVPLTAPHTPWLPTPKFRGTSEAGTYGDFVAQVDDALGQLLDTLDELDLADNTLVIFTSDNGSHWTLDDIDEFGHRANDTWRGQKADIHEGGHRVPFLVRWPGQVPAGSARPDLLVLTDLFATFASITNQTPAAGAGEDSYDALPVLRDLAIDEPVRDHAVHHSLNGVFALREGRWKLIEGKGSGGFTGVPTTEDDPPGQLYDLRLDPGEATNLYGEEPAVVARLQARLDTVRGE